MSPTAFPDVQNNSVVFVDFSTKNNESARVVLTGDAHEGRGRDDEVEEIRFVIVETGGRGL